jgi:hypothetical protein
MIKEQHKKFLARYGNPDHVDMHDEDIHEDIAMNPLIKKEQGEHLLNHSHDGVRGIYSDYTPHYDHLLELSKSRSSMVRNGTVFNDLADHKIFENNLGFIAPEAYVTNTISRHKNASKKNLETIVEKGLAGEYNAKKRLEKGDYINDL